MHNLVWFKKDLRLLDHEPLHLAIEQSQPTLLVYLLEPIILNDYHYSQRHFDFIKQSLNELNHLLAKYKHQILVLEADAVNFFNDVTNKYNINHVF